MVGEYLDLYDNDRNLTGERIFREKGKKAIVPDNKNILVVTVIMENNNNELLLQKTSPSKGSIWALTGGHVISGQSSLDAIKSEISEELGLTLGNNELKLLKTYKENNVFRDVYYIKKNIDLLDIVLQEEEVSEAKYYTKKEVLDMIDKGMIRESNIPSILDFIK